MSCIVFIICLIIACWRLPALEDICWRHPALTLSRGLHHVLIVVVVMSDRWAQTRCLRPFGIAAAFCISCVADLCAMSGADPQVTSKSAEEMENQLEFEQLLLIAKQQGTLRHRLHMASSGAKPAGRDRSSRWTSSARRRRSCISSPNS